MIYMRAILGFFGWRTWLVRHLFSFPLLQFCGRPLYDVCYFILMNQYNHISCTACRSHRTSQRAESGRRVVHVVLKLSFTFYKLSIAKHFTISINIRIYLYLVFYYGGLAQNWITAIRLNPTRIFFKL